MPPPGPPWARRGGHRGAPPEPPRPRPPIPPEDRPSRTWWRVLGSLAAIVVVAGALLQIVGLVARTTETVRRNVDVDGVERLVVTSNDGNLSVTGADREDVRVVAHLEHGIRRTRLRIEREGDTLRVSSTCPPFPGHCGADYTIEVPRDLRVVARLGNGDVTARDLGAPAELSSGNGNVRASGITGDARLDSGNGDVTGTGLRSDLVDATSRNGNVSVELLSAPDMVNARSSNGNVDVAVPDDGEPYALDISTANGTRTGDIRTDPDSSRQLRISSRNGDVAVRYSLR